MSPSTTLPGLRQIVWAALVLTPALVWANASGPPNGRTGAPGEFTCHGCHVEFPLNSGQGIFSVNAPAAFDAGDTINIAVSLSYPGQQRWGFEVTALNSSNQPVGQFVITDPARTRRRPRRSGHADSSARCEDLRSVARSAHRPVP